MSKFSKNPFGRIQGKEEFKTSLPFKLDKQNAINAVEDSIKSWKREKKKTKSKFFTGILKSITTNKNKSIHWEFSGDDRELIKIHLVWSDKKIRTLDDVPDKDVLKALRSLKNFYKKISSVKPDISNPDILKCYNVTAKKHGLPLRINSYINQIEVKQIDPFANISFKKKFVVNDIEMDKRTALKYINKSICIFKQIEKGTYKSNINKTSRNILCSSSSYDYYDIFLMWADKEIRRIKNVKKEKVMKALASLKKFVESIDSQNPNIEDPKVKKMYLASKNKHQPQHKLIELLPVSQGGLSYWSYRQHKWIKGKIDRKTKEFIAPKKNL